MPAADAVDGIARTRVEMAHVIEREMARRLRAGGMVTFDDGLVEARDALADADIGEGARELLQRRYAVALVDEAQDTDPIQWQIIRSVFDDARLVVVGDPKQSIYSFRSADVESYLAAVDGADEVRTLGTNWRSDGPLLTALDTLFTGATFGDDRIAYAAGRSRSRTRRLPGSTGRDRPSTIHRFGDDIDIGRRKDGDFYIDEAREAVAADVASEIVRLLTSGATIRRRRRAAAGRAGRHRGPVPHPSSGRSGPSRARRPERTVGDLAHRRRLSVGGGPRIGGGSCWRSNGPTGPIWCAWRRRRCWSGIDPTRSLRSTMPDVLELQDRIAGWQTILSHVGVPALVADIHRTTGFAARVLALPDGERLMTDFAHIAEEMHAVWRRNGSVRSPAGWRARWPNRRSSKRTTSRSPSRVNAVSRPTPMRSRCRPCTAPRGWSTRWCSSRSRGTHHRESRPFRCSTILRRQPGTPLDRRLVDVGGPSDHFDDHVAIAMAEAEAEEGRLLYVALTRAKHRLHVWWIEDAKPTAGSKLTELIDHDGRGIDGLVEAGGGTIAVTVLDDVPGVEQYEHSTSSDATLDRARFERPLDHTWQRASFTSLSSEHPLTSTETSEQPLREDEETVARRSR